METLQAHPRVSQGVRRRDLLTAGLAASVTLASWPLPHVPVLWAAEAEQPKRGGILRVRGGDPAHFDPHLTVNNYTNYVLSFVYSRLVRHKVGMTCSRAPSSDLAEHWEALDDTYVFHLRKGSHGTISPLNGREFVAEDVKFTYDRFLTEKGNANRYILSTCTGSGGGPLYRAIPPQRALRLAGPCAG
jgi:ABC-type transport system substrate-binding protein